MKSKDRPGGQMNPKLQFRCMYQSPRTDCGICFIDAPDEEAARLFFAASFPRATLLTIKLEPVGVCNAYEKRGPP